MAAAIGAACRFLKRPVLWWLISVVVPLSCCYLLERRGLLLFRAHWWYRFDEAIINYVRRNYGSLIGKPPQNVSSTKSVRLTRAMKS